MADIIVSDLVTNLSQLLSNTEVNFLEEDKEGVRSLCNEFRYIKLLINSYEGKPIKDNIMFPVDKIKEVASEAEKIYEGYVENVAKQKKRSNLVKLLLGSNQARMFHDFTEKITKLQTKIRDIYEYHIQQKGVSEDAYQFQKHRPKGVDEAQVSQRHALLQKQSPKAVFGSEEEEETLVNQRHIQQTSVDEAEGSQSHALMQKQSKEVEEDDVVSFEEEEETLVNQLQIQQASVDDAEVSQSHDLQQRQTPKEVEKDDVVGFEEEEETLVNQQQTQQTSVDEGQGSQSHDLQQKQTPKEVEEDDVVSFEEEEETLVNQLQIQQASVDDAEVSQSHDLQQRQTPKEVEKDDVVGFEEEEETLVNQQQTQQTKVDEAQGSQSHDLQQKQRPKEVEKDDVVGFEEEEETLVNQQQTQQTSVDEGQGSQSHDLQQKQRPKEVDEDDVVGFEEEEKTLVNQQQTQQTKVDEAQGSQSHDLQQKQTPKEVEKDDVVGFEEEEETLVNQQQTQQTSVDEGQGSQSHDLQQKQRPKEVDEDDVVGFEEEEKTLVNQQQTQQTKVDEAQGSQSHDLQQKQTPKEVEKDDVVGFEEEEETLVNQQQTQQTKVDEAQGSQSHDLQQKQTPKEVEKDDVVGFEEEEKTLVNQQQTQQTKVDEAQGSQSHDLQQKQTPKEVEKDDVVGFEEEEETLVNQQQTQQTSVDEGQGSQSHDLQQKQTPKEVDEDDVVGFEEEEKTLVNQQQTQQTKVDEAQGSQSHDLQQKQTPKEVEEDDVVGLEETEELGMTSISGRSQMADAIVSSSVTNLSQLVVNEVNFLEEVAEEVRSLCDELHHMNNFLKKSEGKRNQHDNVMVLLRRKIRDVALEAEDIVDKYVVNVAKEKRKNKLNCFSFFYKILMLHNVRVQIKVLETRIEEIYANREKYNIQQTGNNEAEESRRHALLQKQRNEMEEDDVVGLEEETKTLVNQLVNGTEELDVISISGMGGLGKTTLAKKVYEQHSVKYHFSWRAWVSVSQDCNMKELLLAILNEVAPMTVKMSEMKVQQLKQELKQELKKQLSRHKYLVVLDDVWKKKHWDELKGVFPNDKIGSRVLITTRIIEVARHVSRKSPFYIRFLNDEESWELFTKKVFRGQFCPDNLESLGKKIVAECGGLPLAIVVLGGLLASMEKTEQIWTKMVGGVNRQLAQKTTCLDILGLSYSELPPYLKPCFLYLGLFPEDYKIPVRQLIQLWISEGFIQDEERMQRKEEVAENYLQELIDRSLIQVEEKRSDGGIKTCRVHHLIHDLCDKLSEEEKFLESYRSVPTSQTKPRRLAIHCSRQDDISNAHAYTRQVRTLLCFNQDKHKLSEEHWEKLFKCFKLLRVLDLGNGEVHRLPKAIDKLILLKYLRVKTADISGIPSTIFNLHQLQTLDLRMSRINVLPEGIWRMRQLRHLYLDGPSRLPKKAGTDCLFDLQTLCYVSQDHTGRVRIAEKAPNLRKLGLYGYQCYFLDEEKSTFDLPHLESLKFSSECVFDEPIRLPPSITKISIKTAFLQFETIEIFQNLPNLQILKLDGASFDDDKLVFKKGWFPQLQLLKIEDSRIVSWKLGRGAVPKLKRVVISKCPGLEMIPEELWDITSLQKLELLWLPKRIGKMIGDFKKSDQLEVVIYPDVDSELV
ncbi:disease resistance RPP8-like protein 3 [Macadamia integrifolia]|uniref:disease resistance RPP8-like protein 3 n=1 Tax=Macadamia integrifolia TaxID=60698 RepID=UPI001C532E6E|nr:disease resistance RPP8-like protein 3 [Macadamia integrifolia]